MPSNTLGTLSRARASLGLLCAAWFLPSTAGAQGLRPGTLLVYYGYPTSINATFSVPAAAAEFGRYDYVVWGDGLDGASHPDHANAVAILADPAMATTRVFGYVDVGVSTQNLPMVEIEARIARWKTMGVNGVFLDDFGYDFGTGRDRQNEAVNHAHGQGLCVIANAFRAADAFASDSDPVHNPAGSATSLGAEDLYLYESHGIRLGQYEAATSWRDKSEEVELHRQALGFRVLSVTTTGADGPGAYDPQLFFYGWHAATLCGHAATGWGEYGFSASGASNGLAPFRERPTLDPGTTFTGPVLHAGVTHWRGTDRGALELDTAQHTHTFHVGSVGVGGGPERIASRLVLAPNPVLNSARVEFRLARAGGGRLAVYDVRGRRVATLAEGEFTAGVHVAQWAGIDAAGRAAAAGCYFMALDAEDRRSVVRLVFTP